MELADLFVPVANRVLVEARSLPEFVEGTKQLIIFGASEVLAVLLATISRVQGPQLRCQFDRVHYARLVRGRVRSRRKSPKPTTSSSPPRSPSQSKLRSIVCARARDRGRGVIREEKRSGARITQAE